MKELTDNLNVRFKTETAQTLWNYKNYFFSKYSIDKNNVISLLSANDTYLDIKNYSKNNIGMNIADFGNDDEIFGIKKIFEVGRKNLDTVCFLTEYMQDKKCTLWRVYVKIDLPTVRFMGEMVRSFNEYVLFECKNGDYPSETMMVTNKDKKFYVDMFSDGIEKIFPNISAGYSTDELKKEGACCIKMNSALEVCVSKNKTIRYYDKFDYPSGKRQNQNMYIVMTPFNNSSSKSVLINFFGIDCDFYSDIYLRNDISSKNNLLYGVSDSISSTLWAFCILDCNTLEEPIVLRYNKKYNELLSHREIDIKSILESSCFKKAVSNKIPASDLMTYKKGGIKYTYSLTVIPKPDENYLDRVFVSITPIEKTQMNDVFSKLTPREKQAVKLVLDGYTNKYIAYTLKISEGTVKKILYNSYHKLGVRSRVEIVKMVYGDENK